jgi:uncharacterized protein (DUF433 family)
MKTAPITPLKHPYIVSNPKISGGSPIIKGTRIRVIDIAIEYDRLGMTPAQIIDAHPHLTLSQVHDALSYYYENKEDIDNEIQERERFIEELAQKTPSILKRKLGKDKILHG